MERPKLHGYSMMDSKVMEHLHTRLSTIKSNTHRDFGGVNLIFVGDFLQLLSVSHLDLYNDNLSSDW
jgi:PIF1-like helicase